MKKGKNVKKNKVDLSTWTDKKQLVFFGLITLCVFVLTLIQNFWTQYVSDDWCYTFVYKYMGHPNDQSRRVGFLNIFDVVESMISHWKVCNGRVVTHGLLQLVLSTSFPSFHKVIFNIVNSLMYVGLGLVIYKHSTYGKKHSALLLLGIYLLMWLYIPQYGATVLWASGSANYLWSAVIILAYLLPYRVYLEDSKNVMRDNRKNLFWMCALGLFAGCSNENSGGALALMCILFVITYKIQKISIPKWAYGGIGSTIIGAYVLIKAPGNYRISSSADFAELLRRMEDTIAKSRDMLFPLTVIAFVVLLLVWMSSKGKGRIQYEASSVAAPGIYLIGAVASIGVLIFAAMRPERTWFISICLIITVIGYMFTEINFKSLGKCFAPVLAVFVLVVYIATSVPAFRDMNSTHVQVKAQSEIINNALATGNGYVEIKIVKPTSSKYDYMSYVHDFSPNENEWQNCWASRYFGLDKIKGIE